MRHLLLLVALAGCGVTGENVTPLGDQARSDDSQAPAAGSRPPVTDSVVGVAASDFHMCAVTKSGAAYCWGSGGALGTGAFTDAERPTRVAGDHEFTAIATASPVTCAIDRQRQAWCWGAYDEGQLGAGVMDDSSAVPKRVAGHHRFVALAAGGSHMCALDEYGAAWCWGRNGLGQLGDGTTSNSAVPVRVRGVHRLTAIAGSGGQETCGLSEHGLVQCWGNRRTLSLVPLPQQAIAVAPGCAIVADGSAYCWQPYVRTERLPAAERVESTVKFAQIFTDDVKRCATTEDGVTYCWGLNRGGFLGLTPDTSCATHAGPVQCNVHPRRMDGVRFRQIVLTGNPNIAAGSDGRAYWWGIHPVGRDQPRTPEAVTLP